MDAKKIQAAARKALIAAEPAYYSWPPEQQEKFRASMGKKAQNRVKILLLQELSGIACSGDNAADIWNDLPHSMLDNLNWAKLLTRGIGEDLIFLNESMAKTTVNQSRAATCGTLNSRITVRNSSWKSCNTAGTSIPSNAGWSLAGHFPWHRLLSSVKTSINKTNDTETLSSTTKLYSSKSAGGIF